MAKSDSDPVSKRFVEPLGHQALVAGLARSAREETLPHALLFDGPEGIGKFRAAIWLAATLLCEREGAAPCLECGSCKRVRSDSHADLFVVDHRTHAQNAITIHFVVHREPRPKEGYQGAPIDAFLALRSAEGRGKFVIVREAEAMLEEAQNAFLKMLEEPRPGVHLILETSSAASLLATVRSRVVPVRFEALDPLACERVLAEEGSIDAGDVPALVRMGAGSPGTALRLHRRGALEMQSLLGAAFSGERSTVEVGTELWLVDGVFPGKTAVAQRRTRARAALELGIELLTDVERVAAGADPATLRHGAIAGRVAARRGPLSTRPGRRAAACAWLSAREDLNLNLSPEALLDRALSVLARTSAATSHR